MGMDSAMKILNLLESGHGPALFVWLFCLAAWCLFSNAAGAAGCEQELTVTEEDDGGEVRLCLSGCLTVKLEATPGTGYGWHLPGGGPEKLEQLGEAVFEPREHGKVVGGPEIQVLRFKAAERGSTRLELDYVRPWEKGRKPEKKYRLTVHID
jgi:predicted secreted protein